ncbi:MAG: DUF3592 domain-containing protein [Thermodesulfobacteriota bacterium]
MSRFTFSSSGTSGTVTGKIGLTLFGLVFLIMGLIFSGIVLFDTYRSFQAGSWTRTPCVITESSVNADDEGYAARIAYRYIHRGITYHSDRINPGAGAVTENTVDEADAFAGRYPVGQEAECYVDPLDPSQSALEQKSLLTGLLVLLPLIFVIVGGGIIYSTWRFSGPRTKTYSLTTASRKNRFTRPVTTAFFLVFFAAGAALGYFVFLPAVIQSIDSEDWPATDCTIQSSRVRSHDSDDGTTYSVDIVYSYSYQGKAYRSSRYKFIGGSSGGYDSKAEVVRRYPPGSAAVCYVNPGNPAEAVLKRELGLEALLVLVPVVFMAVGLFGTLYFIRRPADSEPGRRNTAQDSAGNTNGKWGLKSGPLVLRPRTSPAGKILVTLFIALFWNGIVSVFVFQAIQGWRSGNPDLFLSLFLIPFVLIGAVLFFSVFYYLLAFFNPRPQIMLLDDGVRLGERIGLRWRTEGRVTAIHRFRLVLTGEESATYRRGTDSCTDKREFYRQDLIASENPATIRSGELSFVIPADSMHSFKSEHNAIIWKISLHYDIPRWPDTQEDFEMEVQPMEIGR